MIEYEHTYIQVCVSVCTQAGVNWHIQAYNVHTCIYLNIRSKGICSFECRCHLYEAELKQK